MALVARKEKLLVVVTLVAIGIQVRKFVDCSMMFVAYGSVPSKSKVKLLPSVRAGSRNRGSITFRMQVPAILFCFSRKRRFRD